MEKKNKIVFIIVLVVMLFMFNIHSYVFADEKASLNIHLSSDTKDLLTKNKIYYDIGLYDVKNIDTSKPMALTATLEYDSTILSNPTIEGESKWSANEANNKILLDCASFTPDQTIARITFDTNLPKGTTTIIKIALLNVELSGGNDYAMSTPRINSGTVTITTNKDDITSSSTLPVTGEEPTSSTTIENNSNKNEVDNNNSSNTRNETVFNLTFDDKNKSNDSKPGETVIQKVNTIEPVKDATTSNTPLPQTGVNYIVFIAIGVVIVIGIYTFIRDKKFYD